MKKDVKKLILNSLLYMFLAYHLSNYSYATDFYNGYLDASQIEEVHIKPISSETKDLQYFENKLDKNAFNQFKKLISSEGFDIESVELLIKLNAEEYVLVINFPYIARGVYKIKLPSIPEQEPTRSEKIVFSDQVIKVLRYSNGDIWLFARGSGMRRGFGYTEYSLVNIMHPEKSLILDSVNYVSEELEPYLEKTWKQMPIEIRDRLKDIGEFNGYEVVGDCVNLYVSKTLLKTKREKSTKVIACHKENNFEVKKEILLGNKDKPNN